MSAWVSLPGEVRARIRSLFDIPRSSHVEVHDGKIHTDGTTTEDFMHLTAEKMQEFNSTDSVDFHRLFDLTISKIEEDIQSVRRSVFPIKVELPAKDIKDGKKKAK